MTMSLGRRGAKGVASVADMCETPAGVDQLHRQVGSLSRISSRIEDSRISEEVVLFIK